MAVSGQTHDSATLTQGKSPRYPLRRWKGGLQSRSGRVGEEMNLLPLQEIEQFL